MPKRPIGTVPKFLQRKCALYLTLVVLVFGAGTQMASAVPPDPQRSFEVTDCDAAKARLIEALSGSPLISQEENAETVVTASGWAEKLCGPVVVDELTTEFYGKN